MRKLLYIICSLFFVLNVQANTKQDSIVKKKSLTLRSQIAPLSLMSAGGLVFIGNTKYFLQDKIIRTRTSIDDYLRFVPDVTIYCAHFAGMKHKNSFWNMSKYLAISQISSNFVVQFLKDKTGLLRPTGGDSTFPSRHTADAFVGASAQYNEFIDFTPWFAYCGYGFAATVGVLRLTNNRHWVPDVLIGAGMSMLITNLVFHFEPLECWNPFEKKSYAVLPNLNYIGKTALIGFNVYL